MLSRKSTQAKRSEISSQSASQKSFQSTSDSVGQMVGSSSPSASSTSAASMQASAEYSHHEMAQESHYNHHTSHSSASSGDSSEDTGTSSTSAGGAPPLNKDGLWRVKIYELSQLSAWEDKGTGFVDVIFVPDRNAACVVVYPEEGEVRKPLLESPVITQDVYQLQQDTLIVWTEADGQDYALSFQDARGCNEIWEAIAECQKRMQESNILAGLDDVEMRGSLEDKVIPEMELKNLAQIEEYVGEIMYYGGGTDKLLNLIFQEKFLDKLLDMFEMAEDLNMKQDLVIVYNIMKKIVSINDNYLYKHLLTDSVCQKVVAVFEYDPEYVIPRGTYRNFLKDHAKFKKVAELSDSAIEEKIHQTFRAQYLKDVVFARIIEDPHFNALHSIIMFNQVSILNAIATDNHFLDSICNELKNLDTPRDNKKMILEFIEDFCVTARNVHMADRKQFYTALATKGVFQELQPFLADRDYTFRITTANIIAHALDHDAEMLRSFVLSQHRIKTETLSEVVIRAFISDDFCEHESEEGMKYHYSEIIRMFLDWAPPSPKDSMDMSTASNDQQIGSDFIHLFFTEHLELMMSPFSKLRKTRHDNAKEVVELNEGQCTLLYQLSDLLCHMIRMHSARMKSFILKEDLFSKISLLLLARHGAIRLLPIRIMRIIVSCKDEMYDRYIIKQTLFKPVMDAFAANKSRYNMFDSAVLELLEYIKNVPLLPLVKHLAAEYAHILKTITYVPLGEQFLKFHNEIISKELKEGGIVRTKSIEPWGESDRDQETYFNELDNNKTTEENTTLMTEEPPIPRPKIDDDDSDDLRTRITSRSPMLSTSVPASITVRNRNSHEDTPSKTQQPSNSGNTPPRIRNITFGTKRMAIDEADSRTWNLVDTGSQSSSKSATHSKISFKLASSQKTPPSAASYRSRSSSEGSEKKKLRTDVDKH